MKIEHPEGFDKIKLSLIVYGLTGVGKTYFIASANQCEYTKPCLYVLTDPGDTTLADYPDLDFVRVKTIEELQEVYDFIRYENTKYKSVALDSATELSNISLSEVTGAIDVIGDDGDIAFKDLANGKPPDRYHYNQSRQHMRNFFRAFRDLSKLKKKKRRVHVFITALEKKDEARNLLCPSLPGGMAQESGAYVDILARLTVRLVNKNEKEEEVRHLLLTKRADDDEGFVCLAKNRGGRLGSHLWRPTVGKIFDKWVGAPSGGKASKG
jgi:hypothetical protein